MRLAVLVLPVVASMGLAIALVSPAGAPVEKTPEPTAGQTLASPIEHHARTVAIAVAAAQTDQESSRPAAPAAPAGRLEIRASSFAVSFTGTELASMDQAVESIASRLAAGELTIDSVLARMDQGIDDREWFLLALVLGRAGTSETEEVLVARFSAEIDPAHKGLLALALAQDPTDGAFAEAHGDILDRVSLDGLETPDQIELLERLTVTRELPAPVARLFLEGLECARDPRLARSLALALSATLVTDESIRSRMVAIAKVGDAIGPAVEIARLVADAATLEPERDDLATDALSLLALSAETSVRGAVALRLGQSHRFLSRVLELVADEAVAGPLRVHALAGLASTLPAASAPAGRAIIELARSAGDRSVREAGVQALAALADWSEAERFAVHESLLADPDPHVRREAVANVLDRIGIDSLRPVVELMAREDPHPAVRRLASRGQLG